MPPDGMEKVVCVDDVSVSSVTIISPEAIIALVDEAGIEMVCPAASWRFKKVASPT
jgi:adenine/guanine phosphoribosyltransferase-like PRPP-binding protein